MACKESQVWNEQGFLLHSNPADTPEHTQYDLFSGFFFHSNR